MYPVELIAAYDDVTGAMLDPSKASDASMGEVKFIGAMHI